MVEHISKTAKGGAGRSFNYLDLWPSIEPCIMIPNDVPKDFNRPQSCCHGLERATVLLRLGSFCVRVVSLHNLFCLQVLGTPLLRFCIIHDLLWHFINEFIDRGIP